MDAGVLQGVGLPPARGQADHLPPARVKAGVGLPGGHQWLQQGGLARAGHAGQQGQRSALAEGMDGRALGAAVLRLGGEVQARGGDGLLDGGGRECAGPVGRRLRGQCANTLLDADLGGVRHPHLLAGQAGHQGHVLAAQLDAALLEEGRHPVDVRHAAGDAGADQAARCPHPQLVVVDDGGGAELLGHVAGGEGVGAVVAVRGARGRVWHPLLDRAVLPPDRRGLLAPDVAVAHLAVLAQPGRQAGGGQDLELALGRHALPVQPLRGGIRLGTAQDLLPALGEGQHHRLRHGVEHHGLLVLVVADAGTQRPQLVRQLGLEEGPELVDAGAGQGACVQRPDPAVLGDDHVEQGVVDVRVRVAHHGALGEVGRAILAVLHWQGWTGGVVAEADPGHLAGFDAFLTALALARPAELTGDVAHGAVVGSVDGMPDHGALSRGRGELRRQCDRLMGCQGQIKGADASFVL